MSSRKRRREQPAVDAQLVEIYEDLANVDEKIRLKAAHVLLTKFIFEGTATSDQLKEILRRLFRGLCSGRKAARLGFSIALTEFLNGLLGSKAKKVPGFHDITGLLETLESQTHVSGNVSGQEERDHQFGRLFGAESIIKSGILFQADVNDEKWAQVLDIIFALAKRKPWLREECGFVLFNAINIVRDQNPRYAELILEKLNAKGFAKTPEGIAIWIAAKAECLEVQFPTDVWKHDNPLHRKEKLAVAKILNEGTIPSTVQDQAEGAATQKGAWSNRIHFAWDVIMAKLLHGDVQRRPKGTKTVTFADFWEESIDNNLFATTSSEERKYWGFLLFQRMMHEAPVTIIPNLFTKNLVRCLVNQLSSPERYLHRAAEKTTRSIVGRAKSAPDSRTPILKALLTSPFGDIDFDKITKTKTVETLLSQSGSSDSAPIVALYEEILLRPGTPDDKSAASRRLVTADQLVYAVRNIRLDNDLRPSDTSFIQCVLELFAKYAYFDFEDLVDTSLGRPNPPVSQSTRNVLRTRILSCLAYLVSKPWDSAEFSYKLICRLYNGKDDPKLGTPLLEVDQTIRQAIEKAWNIVESANSKSRTESSDVSKKIYYDSVKLLYSLTMLQIYNEDADAVSVLGELNDYYQDSFHKKNVAKNSSSLIEILLSFVSKPSQLFRRLAQQVFTACASGIDEIGLQSMIEILETKENLSGQSEMFEHDNDGDDDEDDDDESSEASDVEDIEMADTKSAGSSSEDATSDDSDASSDSEEPSEGPDDELAEFNAKLAQALGTRPGAQDLDAGVGSSSDEDMDDEQMEALDSHLETVFRERKKLTSKKTEKKDAKENIVNFKCRVLELLEIYIKQQHANTLALNLLLPILTVIRTTTSPLVSSKACNLIREYSRLCKGDGLPTVVGTESIFELLESVHIEAGKEASNAHGSACSQASLLIVRLLVAQDRENLRRVVKVYASTQEKTLFGSNCKVKTPFFTDWLNWCTSAKI